MMQYIIPLYLYILSTLVFIIFAMVFYAIATKDKIKHKKLLQNIKWIAIPYIILMITKDPLLRYILKFKIDELKKDSFVTIFVNDKKFIDKDRLYKELSKIKGGEGYIHFHIVDDKIVFIKFVKNKNSILQLIVVQSKIDEKKFFVTTNYFSKDKNSFIPIGEIRRSEFFGKYMVEDRGAWRFD